MKDEINAILIDDRDNVATVICPLEPDTDAVFLRNEAVCRVKTTGIPIYHKVAIQDIPVGEPILKYGEPIGTAAVFIAQGAHVHTFNIAGATE